MNFKQMTDVEGEEDDQELLYDNSTSVFKYSTGLTTQQCIRLQNLYGKNEIPDKSKALYLVFLELLIEPMRKFYTSFPKINIL